MSSTIPQLVQPGHINLGIKPYPLTFVPGSTQVYFNNGLPCRCRLQIPIEPDIVIDYLAELDFDQIQMPVLDPGLYQIGFDQVTLNDRLTLRICPITRLGQLGQPDQPGEISSDELSLTLIQPIVPKRNRTV